MNRLSQQAWREAVELKGGQAGLKSGSINEGVATFAGTNFGVQSLESHQRRSNAATLTRRNNGVAALARHNKGVGQ